MWPFARQIQKSDTVAVFIAKDRAYLLLAQSPLDSTGLRYLVTGDFAQSIFTTGRIGTGWNLAAGPPTIWVFRPDIYEAQEILFLFGGLSAQFDSIVYAINGRCNYHY